MTAFIAPINKESVHRICSGQVVVSLAVAMKELVENSIDAGSTNIEIRLKEYGTECIEVIDNGCGIHEENFENLTMKHCTSKLKEFEDLSTVSTFGFRGEALSSLCGLSQVSVITRHKTVSIGTRLDYDRSGNIETKNVCPRQIGTTVIVRNLFATLPVRRNEFLKNSKREFTKAINVLHAYCLISVDKRIVCTNLVGKSKNVIVSLHGNTTIKDNVVDVFGAKQMSSLLEFRQRPPSVSVMEEYFVNERSFKENFFRINGFLSSSVHGQGRSSSDRQFCFINGRPCDLPKVVKVVNAVYHSFNKHQYPFLLLNIELNRESVDVNMTPDKRQIFVENEKLLLATIKTSILELYEPQSSRLGSVLTSTSRPEGDSKVVSQSSSLKDYTDHNTPPCISRLKRNFSFVRNCDYKTLEENIPTESPTKKQPRLDDFFTKTSLSTKASCSRHNSKTVHEQVSKREAVSEDVSYQIEFLNGSTNTEGNEVSFDGDEESIEYMNGIMNDEKNVIADDKSVEKLIEKQENSSDVICDDQERIKTEKSLETFYIENGEIETRTTKRKVKCVLFSMELLRQNLSKLKKKFPVEKEFVRKFRTKIDPSANDTAEEELEKELHKNTFAKMDIIGQFNLGFIVTRLKSDLFIIDQHATDEKYNYETLRKETHLETQMLIRSQSLDLTAADEILLMEKLDIFHKNGFGFEIDMNSEVGERVKLSSVPVSKNWLFGKQDIAEMLFMLSDAPDGVMCRPSRVQQMFASRACRKSIMIGTPLGQREMKRLVVHMGEMDQPWNCPHGRPTIRHLLNLSMIRS